MKFFSVCLSLLYLMVQRLHLVAATPGRQLQNQVIFSLTHWSDLSLNAWGVHLKVRYDEGQWILRTKPSLVCDDIAGHLVSIASRPLNLGGQRLIHAMLDPVLWLSLIKFCPLGIPTKFRVIDCSQKLHHGDAKLANDADTCRGRVKQCYSCYNSGLPT
jgi:hypothetical protein